jgi:hypothetical protein
MGETHIFFIRHGESIDDVSRGQYVLVSRLKQELLFVVMLIGFVVQGRQTLP